MKRIFSSLGLLIWILFLPCAIGAPQQPCPEPCPLKGCRGDPAINLQKNRTETPSEFKRLTFGQFVKLNDKAVKRKGRDHWTDEQLQSIAKVEDGKGATLVGYLYDAKYSVAESCNCFKKDLEWRDFHIWIVRSATHATKSESIVVEITPRVRQNKPEWKLSTLRKLILPHNWVKVRVRGYLLFDDEHWDFPTRNPPVRATAWEIHPVTEFEICPPHTTCLADGDTGWVALEHYASD